MEAEAEKIYRHVLDDIVYPLLGKKTTWARDLNRVGMHLLGKNFMGAFSSDKIPDLGIRDGIRITPENVNRSSPLYAIANLDDSTMPGSHWIALAYDINTGKIWVYDSYGRETRSIIPSLVQKYGSQLKTVDRDAEQAIFEEDCGARSMAWLYIFDRYGSEIASRI